MQFEFSAFADESSNAFPGQLDALARNGFRYLEIRGVDGKNVTELTVPEAKEYRQQLADRGLAVWSIGSPIGKIDIHGDFDAHMELYKHTLELAGEFGAENIRLFSFFMPKGEDPAQYQNLVLDRMALFVQTAKMSGVSACHENEKGIYGDIASRCMQLHRALPELKGVFDPANFIQCGQDTWQAWEMLYPYISYMHIKDALPDGNVVPAGKGIGRIKQIIQAFGQQGGSVLSLEPHLSDFVGLKSLEREGNESVVGSMSFASNEEAFDCAAASLKRIVEGIL